MALDVTEHAPELAGLAAVIAMVIPWSVSFSAGGFSEFVALRFVYGSVEFAAGARAGDIALTTVPVTDVGGLYGGPGLERVGTLWLGAALLLSVALLVGLALVLTGELLAAGPLDPIRIMGGLCLCIALLLSGALWLLYQNGSRIPIPLGVVALYFFGAALLTIDRSHRDPAAAETSG